MSQTTRKELGGQLALIRRGMFGFGGALSKTEWGRNFWHVIQEAQKSSDVAPSPSLLSYITLRFRMLSCLSAECIDHSSFTASPTTGEVLEECSSGSLC